MRRIHERIGADPASASDRFRLECCWLEEGGPVTVTIDIGR